MKVREFFAKGGPLDRAFDGYSPRLGQIQFAEAVERTIAKGARNAEDLSDGVGDDRDQADFGIPQILVNESPVGVGKSLGYLVPAVLSGKTVMVVTANLALQDQLAKKDLPLLEKVHGAFPWIVIKGMSNYLCTLGHSRSVKDPPNDPSRQLPMIARWAAGTKTGDLSELPFELDTLIRRALTVTSEECLGSKCPKSHTCYVLDARARAHSAKVVVTNYHMLYADQHVRSVTGGAVQLLPQTDVLVLDEAHRAADIARDCTGFRVTPFMVAWIARHLMGGRNGGGPAPQLGRELEAFSEGFFGKIAAQVGREGILETPRDPGSDELAELLTMGAEKLRNSAAGDDDTQAMWKSAAKRADELAVQVKGFFSRDLGDWAYWVEGGRRAELRASPLDVSGYLRGEIFDRFESVVLTSATLRDGTGFGLVERECGIGAEEGTRLVVDSPFDFTRTSILCPETLPESNSPAYKPAVARYLESVVRRSGGRTLALFTSYVALEVAHEQLVKSRVPFTVLRQGDAPRNELLRRFSSDETSVLLGTDSFWEGVDVPGPALSVVFIDKLPFPRPDDPVVSRLIKLDKRRGYRVHAIGRAVQKLRQGFGRLVRREGDFGVVVVADGRFLDGNYSTAFLRGLPGGLSLTREIDDVDWAEISHPA